MAKKKTNDKVYEYILSDNDHVAFGRYSVLNTRKGKSMIMWQRILSVVVGVAIGGLFWAFPLAPSLRWSVSGACGLGALAGCIFARYFVLSSNEKNVRAQCNSIANINPPVNRVVFEDEYFESGEIGQEPMSVKYKDLKDLELDENGIYIWVSEDTIMYLPAHVIGDGQDMEDLYSWISGKILG